MNKSIAELRMNFRNIMLDEIKNLIGYNNDSCYDLLNLSDEHKKNWGDIVNVTPSSIVIESDNIYINDIDGSKTLVNIISTDDIYQIYILICTDIVLKSV